MSPARRTFTNGTAVCLLGTGLLPVAIQLPLGGCPASVAPITSLVVPLDASGNGSLTAPLPPTSKGATGVSQYLAIDAGLTRIGSTQATEWTIGGFDAVGAVVSQSFSHAAGQASQVAPVLGLR